MYYPEDIVEEVRSANDVVDVINGYIHLTKKGNNYFGLCPFHNEKTPSFSVSRDKQIYNCFACGAGGNVITFVMEYENASFPEALGILAQRAGITLPEKQLSTQEKQEAGVKSRLLDLHRDAAKYYMKILHSPYGEKGYTYLKNRGLTDDTIKRYGLGYAAIGGQLYPFLKKCHYDDELIKLSGLVRFNEKGISEIFWNRVMFPIMDSRSKVIAFGGRVMGEGEPKYLNSPETKIFNKSNTLYGLHVARTARKPYFLICEGYMDVISLHQAGFTNAVAALGTAFTAQHAAVIKRYVKEVVLTFDSDGAGIKAARRAIPILRQAGISMKVLSMKPYKDPDEFIKAEGAEAYQKRIEMAENSFLFDIRILLSEYDLHNPEQKTTAFNEIAKKLLVFTEEIERNNYMEAVCRTYQIEYSSMQKLVNKYGKQMDETESTYEKPKSTEKKLDASEGNRKSERLLLTWLYEEPEIWEKIKHIITPQDFTEPVYRKAAEYIFAQAENHKINPGQILNYFINDEEEYKEAAALFSEQIYSKMTQEEKRVAFKETVTKVKMNGLAYASNHVKDLQELQNIMKERKELQTNKISYD